MMLTHTLAIVFGCCYTGAAKLTDRKKLVFFSVKIECKHLQAIQVKLVLMNVSRFIYYVSPISVFKHKKTDKS